MAINRPREGSLLRIDLKDGTDAFARVLANSQVAIYSHHVPHGSDVLLSAVYGSEILFRLTVMKSALVSGRWPVVDHRPLERELTSATEYFIKDKLTGQFSVYRSSDGSTRASSYEECKALEAAAAWEADHVEERLHDCFVGRTNAWVEQLRAVP
jgi:hypothetical protein